MKHRNHPKRIARLKKKYKHLAAAFAGAMILSSALLPGLPMATAHAAANSNATTTKTATTRSVSANRAGSAAGQNTTANEMPGAAAQPNRTETNNPTSSNVKLQPSSTEKVPAPKAEENKTPAAPAAPKAEESKTPAAPSLPSEGGSAVNTMERTTNPNQDVVTQTPKGNEEKTTAPSQLPSEGGSTVNPVERSANPNQDTVNTPLPPVKGTTPSNTPNNAPTDYKEVINITATAYSPGPLDNDQWGDKTHMGTTIRPGVIAVDPKVIPLGSRVYVEYPDGHGEYKVAEDTGGAIKGNRIDIAIMDRGNAKDFGIQPVKVYVVDTPKKT